MATGTFVGNKTIPSTPSLENSQIVTEFGEVVEDKNFNLEYIYPEGQQNSDSATPFIVWTFEIGADGYYILTAENKTTPLLRFVDTSSRVDLVSYRGTFFNAPSSQPIEYTVQVFESDDPFDSEDPLWVPNEVSGLTEYLFIQRCKRFVKFEIEFFSDLPEQYFNSDIFRILNPTGPNQEGMYVYEFVSETESSYAFTTSLQELTPIEFLFLVEVQIAESSPPNLNDSTRDILERFPSWTKLYEDSTQDATPSLAVPESFGGKFLNALIGDNLDKIESLIDYYNLSKSITGASTNQITWIYSTSNTPELVTSVKGDGVSLSRVTSYSDFISYTNEDYVYYYSSADRAVFTLRPYRSVNINGSQVASSQNETLVFNMFDEFGARVGLPRLRLESNENYKKRILDVYINKPGPDIESFKRTVRRELDLWRAVGSTPDSYFAGATPEILEMKDIINQEKFFDLNGNPTEEFVQFINRLNQEYPTNWGFVPWSDLIWDYAGRFSEGVSKVPFVYDLDFSESTPKYYQPGIGDLSDLSISIKSNTKYGSDLLNFEQKPYHEDVYRKQAILKISGIEKNTTQDSQMSIYAPINLDISYYTEYNLPIPTAGPATLNYVVELDVSGTPYYSNFVDYYTNEYAPTLQPEYGVRNVINPIDNRTFDNIIFKRKSDDVTYLDTSTTPVSATIDQSSISNARVIWGQFAYSSSTPRYIVSNHSSQNSGWLSVPGQSKIDSTSYANGVFVDALTPFITVENPNSNSFQVLYGSNMYDIQYKSFNTPVQNKKIQLTTLNPESATPQYQENFNNYIDNIVRVRGLSTPTYLHVENVKPDFAYIDPDYTLPTDAGSIGYGGWISNENYLSDVYVPNISVRTDNSQGELFATPKYDISNMSATPNNLVFYWDPNFNVSSQQYQLDGEVQRNYPAIIQQWSYFEAQSATPITFDISNRGIIKSEEDLNGSNILSDIVVNRDIHRYEFTPRLSTPEYYIINQIEAIPADQNDNSFNIYTEKRAVKPFYSIAEDEYTIQNVNILPSQHYEEKTKGIANDLFIENVTVRAKLNPDVNRSIESEIHSGWYYMGEQDTYLYARPITEQYNLVNNSSTPSISLPQLARQGAPIIVESTSSPHLEYRQISFPDQLDNSKLSFVNVEKIVATDTHRIYLAYTDSYDISIYDSISDTYIAEAMNTLPGESSLSITSSNGDPLIIGREYRVMYKVKNSYYVDNENNNSSGLYSKIVFNALPENSATQFYVTYESSIFEKSTPTGLVHSPTRTLLNEGYIYLDEKIYDYKNFITTVNPGSIIDDPLKDYMTIAIESLDVNGNPKPYQKYALESSLLNVQDPILETDIDGFAYTKARYSGATPATENAGILYISGIQDQYSSANDIATINYEIIKSESYLDQLYAEPTRSFMEADGVSTLSVNGRLFSKSKNVSNVYVYYRKARTVHEAFEVVEYQSVVTAEDGSFTIGPITAEPLANAGYWFMAIETAFSSAISTTPITIAGDIINWFEDSNDVILNASDRILPVQDSYEADEFIEFKSTPAFKVNYLTGDPDSMTATPTVSLPKWFRIPRYAQYQLGLLGNEYYYVSNNKSFYPS